MSELRSVLLRALENYDDRIERAKDDLDMAEANYDNAKRHVADLESLRAEIINEAAAKGIDLLVRQ